MVMVLLGYYQFWFWQIKVIKSNINTKSVTGSVLGTNPAAGKTTSANLKFQWLHGIFL